jgi:hypothetical protein
MRPLLPTSKYAALRGEGGSMKSSTLVLSGFCLVCAFFMGCKGSPSSSFNLTSVERDPRTGQVTGASNVGVNVDKGKLSNVNVNDVGPGGAANFQYNRPPASPPQDSTAETVRPNQ